MTPRALLWITTATLVCVLALLSPATVGLAVAGATVGAVGALSIAYRALPRTVQQLVIALARQRVRGLGGG